MKLLVVLAVLAVLGFAAAVNDKCEISYPGSTSKLSNYESSCKASVIAQIKREAGASYKYFQMGAYFASDQVNLPGFSEMFFKAAKEERDHSIVLMDYLSTRLAKDADVESVALNLITKENFEVLSLDQNFSGKTALRIAYDMENSITTHIKNIINQCDKDKEYHVSDFLTGDFLTEQYESERSFAGKLATLEKMWSHHGSLAEFMFDKTL